MSRALDYCGVSSLSSRASADEMFDRIIPPDVDMDHEPSLEAVAQRVCERLAQDEKCESCRDNCPCKGGLT